MSSMIRGARDTPVNKTKMILVFTKQRAKEVINKHTNMIILDREVLKSKYHSRTG